MIIDDGVAYEIVWHGATHRECPQPVVADPDTTLLPTRPVSAEIVKYLRDRPDVWHVGAHIRKVVLASPEAFRLNLQQLVARGEIEIGRAEKWGRSRWCYRWKPPEALTCRAPKMSARYREAQRALPMAEAS